MASSFAELQQHIDAACQVAVKNTSEKLANTLQEYINTHFYEWYTPSVYERTWNFYESASYEFVGRACTKIGLSPKYLSFKYPSVGTVDRSITGAQQAELAEKGYHGNPTILYGGQFWSSFVEYAEQNAVSMLKEELRKQGLKIL